MEKYFLAMPVRLYDYKALRGDFEHVLEGRWVAEANLHLTLQFFGSTYEREFLLSVLSTLQLQIQSSELMGLALLKNNTILYAKTFNPSLYAVHEAIQKAFGLDDTQEFTPHVTLLRIKKRHHDELLQKRLLAYEEKIVGRTEGEILLMQSHTTPEGTRYSVVKRFC